MKRALELDFVCRPRRLRRLGVVLLLASMATAAYLGQAYLELKGDLSAWEAKWRSLQKTQRVAAEPDHGKKMEGQQLQAELKIAGRVIERLSTPWDRLFQEVEGSIGEQVTLLSVEPDTEKRELRIVAEAKNLAAMLEYVKGLRNIALFRDAHVLSHQVQQQDPQRPVRFVVSVQWLEWSQLPKFEPLLQLSPPFEGGP